MYDWIGFLAPHFKKLPGIKKGHHFYLTHTYPGEVFVKERANQSIPKQHRLLTAELTDGSFPTVITPSGLSPHRQWYLYEKIREVNTHEWACEKTTTHTYTHAHATHTHTYMRAHTHTHTHACTHTHTHTLVAADLTVAEILYIQCHCLLLYSFAQMLTRITPVPSRQSLSPPAEPPHLNH